MTRLSPFALRLVVALAFVPVLALAAHLAARGLDAALARSAQWSYFDQALTALPPPRAQIDWAPPARPLDRPLGPGARAEVARAVTDAWALYAAALATGEAAYLPDRFTGTALARARHASTPPAADQPRPRMVVLHQRLQPRFHHLDGTLLALQSQALTFRFALSPSGALIRPEAAMDQTTSVLVNLATGWHITAHERQSSRPAGTDRAAAAAAARAIGPLTGVNYYPAATPWTGFWPGFDPVITAGDLDRLQGLGANSLRIFLTRAEFLDPAGQAENLPRLQALLEQAQARGLRVIPTLFDLRGGYDTSTWAEDDALLRAVLPVLAASPAVVAVDLKNEPDLDYAAHGKGLVQAWLMAMAADAREIAPGLPLTIGFSAADPAAEMAGLVDAVSYHDYAPVAGAAGRLAMVRAAAGDKPLWVTEIGASSWSLLAGFPGSPEGQAERLAERMAALSAADGLMVWTLHDFPAPDRSVIGASPWRLRLQSAFGLVDSQGRDKPAAAVVARAFHALLTETRND